MLFLKPWSHYASEDDLLFLSLWDYKHIQTHILYTMLGTKPRTSWILSRHSNEPYLQVKIWISYKQQMTFSISILYTILGTNLNKLLLWCWLKFWFNWKIHILPDDLKRKTKSLWRNERLIMVESKYWSNEKGLKFDKGSLKVIKNLIISHQHWEELCGQLIS